VTAQDGDSEGGAPTVILEAQAAGMPVIATNHADIPNIVVPGQSALLSNERDVEGLVKNIAHLLDHPEQWEIMGKEGRAFVEKFHDIKKEAEALEQKYRSLLTQ
jgi:colanic acid/amylovoran biosynthesis glycosyltransferase